MMDKKSEYNGIKIFDLYNNALEDVKFYKKEYEKAYAKVKALEYENYILECDVLRGKIRFCTLISEILAYMIGYNALKSEYQKLINKAN